MNNSLLSKHGSHWVNNSFLSKYEFHWVNYSFLSQHGSHWVDHSFRGDIWPNAFLNVQFKSVNLS